MLLNEVTEKNKELFHRELAKSGSRHRPFTSTFTGSNPVLPIYSRSGGNKYGYVPGHSGGLACHSHLKQGEFAKRPKAPGFLLGIHGFESRTPSHFLPPSLAENRSESRPMLLLSLCVNYRVGITRRVGIDHPPRRYGIADSADGARSFRASGETTRQTVIVRMLFSKPVLARLWLPASQACYASRHE